MKMKTVLIIAGLFGLMLFLIWFDSFKLELPQPSVSEPIEQHGMLSDENITLSGGSHAKPLMWDPNKDCWVEDKE